MCYLLKRKCHQIDLIYSISEEIPFKSNSADYPTDGADVIWEKERRTEAQKTEQSVDMMLIVNWILLILSIAIFHSHSGPTQRE